MSLTKEAPFRGISNVQIAFPPRKLQIPVAISSLGGSLNFNVAGFARIQATRNTRSLATPLTPTLILGNALGYKQPSLFQNVQQKLIGVFILQI